MKFQFFRIGAQHPEDDQAVLNQFCSQHRVTAVDKQFVAAGANSFWAICVTVVDGGAASAVRIAAYMQGLAEMKLANPPATLRQLSQGDGRRL